MDVRVPHQGHESSRIGGQARLPRPLESQVIDVGTQVRPDHLHLAQEDRRPGRPDADERLQQVGRAGGVTIALAVQAPQVTSPALSEVLGRLRELRGRPLVVATTPPRPRASTRCCQVLSAIRRGVRQPALLSSRAARTAMSESMRADSSNDSTSSRHSGAGLSVTVMPASSAQVAPSLFTRSSAVVRALFAMMSPSRAWPCSRHVPASGQTTRPPVVAGTIAPVASGYIHDTFTTGAPMTTIDLGRPTTGDVVDLILDDHRRFELLLRKLRSTDEDRDAVRWAFATLHVAHAEAEEQRVYPALRHKRAIDEDEREHGEKEHAEGNQALLAVLECAATDTQKFDDAVEELARVVNHHLTEEELTILNPARDDVADRVRIELGEAFADERQRQVDADCGSLENVSRLVRKAVEDGLLDEE